MCPTRDRRGDRRRDRLPDHDQGRRRRRRKGHARRRAARRSAQRRFAPRARKPRAAFGDSAIYLERRLATAAAHRGAAARPISMARVLPFVERECSIQRRHQKVIEETPSPVVSPALRRGWPHAAAAVAASVGYTNAGTIEFLLDEDGPLLLPRDEHASPGRASDHRDGDRRRSRAVADSDRARRAARRLTRTQLLAPARPRHRVPRLRRGSGRRLHAVARPHHALRVPAGRAFATTAGSKTAREVPIYLRPADLEADRVGRRSTRRPSRGCGVRLPNTRSRHQDDRPVLRVDAGAAGLRRGARSTRAIWTSSCTSARSSRSRQTTMCRLKRSPRSPRAWLAFPRQRSHRRQAGAPSRRDGGCGRGRRGAGRARARLEGLRG